MISRHVSRRHALLAVLSFSVALAACSSERATKAADVADVGDRSPIWAGFLSADTAGQNVILQNHTTAPAGYVVFGSVRTTFVKL
jgi:hypothetical protein